MTLIWIESPKILIYISDIYINILARQGRENFRFGTSNALGNDIFSLQTASLSKKTRLRRADTK